MPSYANERKGTWGFWVEETSYGRVTRKGMVNKGCIVRLVTKIEVGASPLVRVVE